MNRILLSRRQLAGRIAAVGSAAILPSFGLPLLAQVETAPDNLDPLTIALDDLIAANKILSNEGIIDAFGHVSCRHPLREGHFLMARTRIPALVEIADIMEFDRDGKPVDAKGRRPYVERFIHSSIYEARPDIRSVVHHHSVEVIPFSLSTIPLRAVSHVGGIIGEQVPVWDIADVVGGKSNLLVTNVEIGRSLARKLGNNNVLLMRGHGAASTGGSIRQAVIAAITINSQARLLRDAIALGGDVKVLSPGE